VREAVPHEFKYGVFMSHNSKGKPQVRRLAAREREEPVQLGDTTNQTCRFSRLRLAAAEIKMN
jgi:hypothetical protein